MCLTVNNGRIHSCWYWLRIQMQYTFVFVATVLLLMQSNFDFSNALKSLGTAKQSSSFVVFFKNYQTSKSTVIFFIYGNMTWTPQPQGCNNECTFHCATGQGHKYYDISLLQYSIFRNSILTIYRTVNILFCMYPNRP